ICVAFFVRSDDGTVTARFPSPAGATTASVAVDDWRELVESHPLFGELTPEVEALLVYRRDQAREQFRISIDECFRLVGLVRRHWRGLGGGDVVWTVLADFFDELRSAHA